MDVMSSRLCNCPAWPGPAFTRERRGPTRAPHEAAVYRDQLRSGGQHLRVPEGLGLLYGGFVRALRYAEEIGALSADEARRWREDGWRVMARLATKQSALVNDERPVLKYATIVRELLAQGKLYTERRGPPGEGPHAQPPYLGSTDGERIGWHDAEYFHFLPRVAYHSVATFARAEGHYFGIKEDALRRALAEEGLLEAEEGRHTIKLRVGAEIQRVMRIRRTAFEKLWEAN